MSAPVSDQHAAWLAVMVERGWVVELDEEGHIKSLTSPEGVAATRSSSSGGVDPSSGND